MSNPVVLADTSLLIDFFRKRNKANTAYFQLQRQYGITISMITVFEFKIGALNELQRREYEVFLQTVTILPLTEDCIEEAISVYNKLKRRNARIGLADTLIAATALANDLSLATLNTEHFARVEHLSLVALSNAQ